MPEFSAGTGLLTLWALIGYLAGSIPFGLVLSRQMGLGDLRKIGSGNIGATNVLRTGNRAVALATLLLDGGKGAVAVLVARALVGEDAAQIAGGFAFLGHCFPLWLRFRGGKGVATFLGIMLALAWPVGLAACATWAVTAAALRYSSAAALLAAGLAPVWALLLGWGEIVFLGLILAVMIYLRHAGNIVRLHKGIEPKIGRR